MVLIYLLGMLLPFPTVCPLVGYHLPKIYFNRRLISLLFKWQMGITHEVTETATVSLRTSFSDIDDLKKLFVVELQWMLVVKATVTVTHARNNYNYRLQSPHR